MPAATSEKGLRPLQPPSTSPFNLRPLQPPLQPFDTWELQPATGEKRRVISSTFRDLTPQYSPDGSQIAFSSSRSGHQEIWLCDRDGSNPTQLTDLKSRRTARPYWSPDGSWITFRSFVGDQLDVFVTRASGGEPRNLTDHPAQDTGPTISRDGSRIYFRSDRSGENAIWSIAPEGGEPVQVTSGNDLYALESVETKGTGKRRGRCPLTRESDVLTASISMRYGHAFVQRALAQESALLTL